MTQQLLITDQEFTKLRNLIFEKFGINLTAEKKQLLVSRLFKLLEKYNLKDFSEYYNFVVNDKMGRALDELVNKISTNYSFFYRENDHFNFFIHTLIPDLIAQLKKDSSNDIRLWCAGCASGEEPYTIIMLLKDYFNSDYSQWNAGILATDISQNALTFAHRAIYPEERIFKLPEKLKSRFLEKDISGDYKVKSEITSEVIFRRFNLMNEKFPFKKKFHAIFCRNVMIYFDQDTKNKLVDRFVDNLEVGGYLFVGHSESLGREHADLDYVMPAVYRKK